MATAVAKKPPVDMSRMREMADMEANWKTQDEARLMPGVRIYTKKKFLFRFLPGTGPASLNLRIDKLPDDFVNERQEAFYRRSLERRTKRVHGENAKYDLDSIREKVGSDWITFTALPGSGKVAATCYYATDDPEVAAFVRHKIRVGKSFWQHLREERPGEMIEVNGISIPNTSEGWEAARKASQMAALQLDDDLETKD